MKRIDSVNARPDENGIGKAGFNDNVDLPQQDATYLSPDWLNMIQEELCNLLELHGVAINPESKRQLYDLLTTQSDLDDLATAIESDFIRKSQIADDLETADATKVASARTVKELHDNKLEKTDLIEASTTQKGIVQLINDLTSGGVSQGLSAEMGKVLNETKSTVVVMTGIIANGAIIPLPSGFTENQCNWMVSLSVAETNSHAANNQGSDIWYQECFTTGRVVTARVHMINTSVGRPAWRAGTANYIVIGVK